MGTKRRNEVESMVRQEPMAYIAEFDGNDNVEYEAWAPPGTETTEAKWIAAKHTYDAGQNLTRTQWAQGPNGQVADFGDGNVATSISTLTYV